MSLLIKALNKAEQAQAQNAKIEAQAEKSKLEQTKAVQAEPAENKAMPTTKGETEASNKLQSKIQQNPLKTANSDVELSLSPTGSSFSETVVKPASITTAPVKPALIPASSIASQPASNQQLAAKSAANVFSAKGIEAKTDSTRLALIAGAGLIALLGMGLYFYQFVDNSPPIVVPPRPLEQVAAQTTVAAETVPPSIPEAASLESSASEAAPVEIAESPVPPAFESTEPMLVAEKDENVIKKRAKAAAVVEEDEFSADENSDENSVVQPPEALIDVAAATKPSKKMRKSTNNAVIASDSASIQVTKSTPQAGINPVLISAYDAYNAGNDSEAQKLYKQVLKRDIHNADALLGLGAIAARQGRSADANGWYGKVLEVDPRNNIAKTAMLDNQSQGNEQANETSLKNMLAKQPNDANLHVALGNLYAEQNQWPAAQQAYFDAYSLNKTADNAYNLAVSLDQMGKPKLALPYYQRALEQASGSSSIDKAALEARMAAIQ